MNIPPQFDDEIAEALWLSLSARLRAVPASVAPSIAITNDEARIALVLLEALEESSELLERLADRLRFIRGENELRANA